MESIQKVIKSNEAQIMKIKGVVGIAAALSKTNPEEKCVRIYVSEEVQRETLPKEIQGYKVEIIVKKKGFKAFFL